MNDPKTIQERLRELTWWGGPLSGVYPLIREAADRIEELETSLREIADGCMTFVSDDDPTDTTKTRLPLLAQELRDIARRALKADYE